MRYRLRTLLIVLALGPPVLAVGYLLSIGPAWRLYHLGTIKRETFYAIYLPPLQFAAKRPALKRAVEGYGALWLCDWPAGGGCKPELSSE